MPLYPQDTSRNSAFWNYTEQATFASSTYADYTSILVPANTITPGTILRVGIGYGLSAGTNPSGCDIQVLLGSTQIFFVNPSTLSTANTYYSEFLMVAREGNIQAYIPSTIATTANKANTTINLALNQTLRVQARCRTSNTTFLLRCALIEILKP